MKKLVVFFAIALFLSIPLTANADTLVGTEGLTISWNGTYPWGGYATLYYGTTFKYDSVPDFGYWITNAGVFCVSSTELNNTVQPFDFYTISNNQTMARAAWVADNWTSYSDYGSNLLYGKSEAQKAIWQIVGAFSSAGSGFAKKLYDAAMSQDVTSNSHWYYADDSQDFLTPRPVPEPGILILLGLAMSAIGIAVPFARKI
jgi:hypothetical protein